MTDATPDAVTDATQIVLRPMRWWDIAEVLPLEQALFGPTAWSAEQFWGELARVPESRWYAVAQLAERIVGYAGLYAVPPDADVQTIAVAPAAQGRGLGGRLLEALVEQARERGCSQVFLEVRVDNGSAVRLYERHGFERISTRRDYYGPGQDALVMRRRRP